MMWQRSQEGTSSQASRSRPSARCRFRRRCGPASPQQCPGALPLPVPVAAPGPSLFCQLRKGETLEDLYIFESVNSGGRSIVKLGTRKLDGLKVAVKVQAKRSTPADHVWRLRMEQLHSLPRSPHVLEFLEVLEDEASFYLVMPQCNGGELWDFLAKESEVPEFECKRILRELLLAVRHLHQAGWVHRDVKPENVMFHVEEGRYGSKKTIKLIDFDTVTKYAPGSHGRVAVGTAQYMAPEALQGEVTPLSDIWSIGLIMYILMRAQLPYESLPSMEGDYAAGGVAATRAYKSLQQQAIDWEAQVWQDFPEARDLCSKLLAFQTEARLSADEALAHPWLTVETPMHSRRSAGKGGWPMALVAQSAES